jgi:lipid A ethanolaminephosphotransferase
MEEGTVPLVVISGRDAKALDWNRYLAKNENKTSHYHIFPTLLSLMGFDALMIRKTYGAPISDLLDDPLTFNTRFNAHFGMPPLWRKIDPTMIAMPPDDSQR